MQTLGNKGDLELVRIGYSNNETNNAELVDKVFLLRRRDSDLQILSHGTEARRQFADAGAGAE